MALTPAIANSQTNGESLSTVAARNGYSMQWLLPEREAALYRAGVVIVVRPGATLYEVNDRVEVADVAPRYINGDMLISSRLAARLKQLAVVQSAQSQPGSMGVRPQNFTGTISIEMRPQPGSEAVTVNGQAPPGAPVTLTLLATISSDLPTVPVSRHDVQPDVNGRFSATLPIAGDYYHGSLLRVVATSTAGVTPATAQLFVDAPNVNIHDLPADQWPPR
jgi:hypothetical protein